MRESQTEVLVVGAGPVGLWTAVLLAEAGIQVTVVDREQRTATRSYACALHPGTLRRVHAAGLLEPVLERGRRIEKLAFYDGSSRRIELSLADAGPFPYLVILPQGEVESILEQRLRTKGVHVLWNHRFETLTEEPEAVLTIIEELAGTGTGYIVPHWETVVKSSAELASQFVVGADGHNSRVRHALGIDFEKFGGRTSFAAFEFETNGPVEPELRIVLGATTNVLWPIAENACRWTFQIDETEMARDFPQKERRSARVANSNVDDRVKRYVEKVAGQRAPWFKGAVKEIAWCTEVSFEQRLANQFGRNRCWLVGDAAHQTGPVGVQSMNAGFAEAGMLVEAIKQALRHQSGHGLLGEYQNAQAEAWRRLLGLKGGLKVRGDTEPWVRENAGRILSCLPASGPELAALAGQLRLDVA